MGRSDDSSVSPTTRPIETQTNEGAREPVVWETVEVGSTIEEMVAQLRLIDEVREFGTGSFRGLFAGLRVGEASWASLGVVFRADGSAIMG